MFLFGSWWELPASWRLPPRPTPTSSNRIKSQEHHHLLLLLLRLVRRRLLYPYAGERAPCLSSRHLLPPSCARVHQPRHATTLIRSWWSFCPPDSVSSYHHHHHQHQPPIGRVSAVPRLGPLCSAHELSSPRHTLPPADRLRRLTPSLATFLALLKLLRVAS